MEKVGTSNPDGTISLKRLQCVAENKHILISSFEIIEFIIKRTYPISVVPTGFVISYLETVLLTTLLKDR